MHAIVSKQIGLRRVCQRVLFCTVLLILTASGAHAEDHFWSSSSGGSFNYWLNWVPDWVPGEDDRAVFELGMDPAYEVTFYESVTNLECVFRTDEVILDLGGFTYTLTHPGNALTVGENTGDVAEVIFYDGTIDTTATHVGLWEDSSGTLDLESGLTLDVSDHFTIGHEGDGLVTIHDGASVTAEWAFIGGIGIDSNGVVNVDGANAEFTVNETLRVGESGYGVLNVQGDSLASARIGYIGDSFTGYGEIHITDGAEFIFSEWLATGGFGGGLLTISQAGRLELLDLSIAYEDGSIGQLDLLDVDSRIDASRYILVGDRGSGTMNVSLQATVTAESLLVGVSENTDGELNISDADTTVTVQNNLVSGLFGVGTINITNGADVRTAEPGGWIFVGQIVGSDGYMLVDGGSFLTAENAPLVVGEEGQAWMDIFDGSEVHTSGELFMGWRSGSIGQMVISGEGSKYASDSGYPARLGDEGQGTLLIEDGGRFEKPGAFFLGIGSTGVGTVTLNGGTCAFKGEQLSVGEYGVGTFDVNDGHVALGYINPGDVPPGEMHMAGYYTQLTGTGTLSGNVVSFDNAKVMPGGDEAASLTGVLTIDGDYTQQDARLTIKIKGPTAGDEYGVLNVTGAASLDGELRITPVEGYEPLPGEEFVVLTAGSVIGTFDATSGLQALIVTYNLDNVVVTIPHPGDLNCDAVVDLSDVEPFIQALIDPAAYQTAYPDCSATLADLDGNGTVDGLDIQPFVGVLLP